MENVLLREVVVLTALASMAMAPFSQPARSCVLEGRSASVMRNLAFPQAPGVGAELGLVRVYGPTDESQAVERALERSLP